MEVRHGISVSSQDEAAMEPLRTSRGGTETAVKINTLDQGSWCGKSVAFRTTGDAMLLQQAVVSSTSEHVLWLLCLCLGFYLIGKGQRRIQDSFQELKPLVWLAFGEAPPCLLLFFIHLLSPARWAYVSLLSTEVKAPRKQRLKNLAASTGQRWEPGKDFSGITHQEVDRKGWRDGSNNLNSSSRGI